MRITIVEVNKTIDFPPVINLIKVLLDQKHSIKLISRATTELPDEIKNNDNEQIKKENEDFIKKIPEIANKCINAIIDKYENKTEKYDELKGQIRNLKNEIQFLKDKNDFTSRTSYKIGSDDYYEALQSQMDDMKDSFLEKFNNLSTHYTNKKLQFQRQIRTLENEKQYCLELQKVLLKRLKDINKYFSI